MVTDLIPKYDRAVVGIVVMASCTALMLPKIHPSTFQYGQLSALLIIPITVVAIAWRVRPSLLLYFSCGCIGAAMILPACIIDTWYPTYNPFGLSTPILLCVILFGIAASGGLCSCLGYTVSKLTLPTRRGE